MAQPLGVQYGQKYTLSGPDGTVAVFNDSTDPNYVGALVPENCSGLDSADVRENADDLVQMDGGVHGDYYLGRRPIQLAGKIFNTASITERNQKIDLVKRASMALRPGIASGGPAAAQGNTRLSWTPGGGVPVFLDLRTQQPTRVTGTGWDKDFQTQLVAADPRIYSQALHQTVLTSYLTGTSGASFAPFAAGFAGATAAASATLVNDGSTTSFPVLYFNGPCINPAVYNATTGYAIAFAYTLAANEGMVVDTLNRTVWLGTRANVTNLATNPSSEVAVTMTSGPVWTVTRATAAGFPIAGSAYDSHVYSGAGGGDTNTGTINVTFPSAGTYTISSWVRLSGSVYTAGTLGFVTDGSFAGSTNETVTRTDPTKVGQWQRISTTVTVVAGDLTGTFVLRALTNPATGDGSTFLTDAVQIEAGATPSRYGDGSFPGWTWSGAANASTSSGPGSEVTATSTNRYGAIDFTNTFWDGLRPGNNDIRFIPYSWTPGAGVRVDWRDAWL